MTLDGLPESNYSVASGILTQGSTSPDGNRQWYESVVCAFDFTVNPVTVVANLKIITSNYVLGGAPRAGWGEQITDSAGRYVTLYVASDRVFPSMRPSRCLTAPGGGSRRCTRASNI